MADDDRIADYFIVAGYDESAAPLQVTNETEMSAREIKDPITDLAVINRSAGESVPEGFVCIEETPGGNIADLNFGSFRCPQMHLCYRRGRHKPPLVHIGVHYEGRDRPLPGCELIESTPDGRSANVNNASTNRTFIYSKRASARASPNDLVVTDICIVIKDEKPPHTFWKIADRNLNNALLGADVFLCFKKATCNLHYLSYQPTCLFRYPRENWPMFPSLPPDVPLFALPMGASLEAWPADCDNTRPVFAKFVLTVTSEASTQSARAGQKLYGAAMTFYEPYSREKLSQSQLDELLRGWKEEEVERVGFFVNKAICLLSRWPFFDAFHQFLMHLLTLSASRSVAQNVPIERIISHLIHQVPFPSLYRPKVLIQVLGSSVPIPLTRPDDLPIPLNGSSFTTMLRNLSAENCANIFLFALLERKICLHSLRPDVLTAVAECVTAMIFPFVWQCPSVPLCPVGLCGLLHAPVPFIVGVDSHYFDLYSPPADVIYVDLDTNSIDLPADMHDLNTKILPKKPAKLLIEKLERILGRMFKDAGKNSDRKNSPQSSSETTSNLGEKEFKQKLGTKQYDVEIQEAFLVFMATILKGYRAYLKPMAAAMSGTGIVPGATDPGALFDTNGFEKSRDRMSYPKAFYQPLTKTQQFIRFIEERSIMSDRAASYSMTFFDSCVEKIEREKTDEVRLIEVESILGDRTVLVPPPDPDPSGKTFTYGTGFPALDYKLFDAPETTDGPSATDTPVAEPVGRSATGSDIVSIRTKQEVRQAQSWALTSHQQPTLWARFLLTTSYAIWFMYLPSLVATSPSASRTLRAAFEILKKNLSLKLQPDDEVCYRVLMKLCGQHAQPGLAVKLLMEMKNNNIQPDAVTYGYYNKVVFETEMRHSPDLLWAKLRHVVRGAKCFADAGMERRQRLEEEARRSKVVIPIGTPLSVKDDEKRNTGGSSDTGFFSMDAEEAVMVDALDAGLPGKITEEQSMPSVKVEEIGSIVKRSGDKARSRSVDTETALTDEEIIRNNSHLVTEEKEESGSIRRKDRRSRKFQRSRSIPARAPDCERRRLTRRHFSHSSAMKPNGVVLRFNPFSKSDVPRKRSVSKTVPESPRKSLTSSHQTSTAVVAGTVEVLDERIQQMELAGEMDSDEEEKVVLEEVLTTPQRVTKSHSVSHGPSQQETPTFPLSTSTDFGLSASKNLLGSFIRNTKSYSSIRKFWSAGGDKKKTTKDPETTSLGSSTFSLDESSPLARGGAVLYSGFKSAKMAFGRKLDELSVTLTTASNSPTPSRIGSSLRDEVGGLNFDYALDELNDRNGSGSFDDDDRMDAVDGGTLPSVSFPTYAHSNRHTCRAMVSGTFSSSLAAHVDMITNMLCSKCHAEVYDEEIMAGWWPDDSNLNSRCPYCATKFLPEISITLYEHYFAEAEDASKRSSTISNCPYLHSAMAPSKTPSVATFEEKASSRPVSISSSQDTFNVDEDVTDGARMSILSKTDHINLNDTLTVKHAAEDAVSQSSICSGRTSLCRVKDVIKVPYLSVLVLRKEMESLIANEGETCFADPNIVTAHSIVYWNLVWYCERIALPQNLTGFLVPDSARTDATPERGHMNNLSQKAKACAVSCRWDDPLLALELGAPMYVSFSSNEMLQDSDSEEFRSAITKNLMEHMLAAIRDSSDLLKPMNIFLKEVSKLPNASHRSLYRELLFLSIRALGSENIDRNAFDKVFRIAFNTLRRDNEFIPVLQANDKPISSTATFCRQAFRPLEL